VTNSRSKLPIWQRLRQQTTPQHLDTLAQPESNTPPRQIIDDTKGDDCSGISDVGLVRERNEDAFYIAPEQDLLVVADGLGGHAAGEVAAALAIESICNAINNYKDRHDPAALLDIGFGEAESVVRELAHTNPEYAGMGTTLIVGLIRGDQLFIAYVGDVRAYHWQKGNLVRLTHDHTAVGHLLRQGLISEDEARHHPARNQVNQAIGGGPHAATPDHVRVTLAPGDRLLLCSDGLWEPVPHSEIAAVLADGSPAFELATRLIKKAIAGGGRDNITAVIYRHSQKRYGK
jgi:serine/threonine protein phosphatase PrpC